MNDLTHFSTHSAPHLDALSALFGPLPPRDDPCHSVLAHQWQGAQHRVSVWQVSVGQPAWVSWLMYRAEPLGPSPEITLISPDGCWPQAVNEAAIQAVLDQGVALAWFDRVGLAWDGPDAQRGGPVHRHWPEVPWSAIAVWAWGMCHSITALEQALQAPKIAVIGHSRGGKAAMAAALWDPRIQALVSHNSGTGGVSQLQPTHAGAERLADLAERFPHWLSPWAQDPQHQALCEQKNWPAAGLQALAPRGLCILQAEDDLWANPAGSRATFEQLQAAWQAAPERLRWQSRTGGHAMTALDWQRAAAFVRQVLV